MQKKIKIYHQIILLLFRRLVQGVLTFTITVYFIFSPCLASAATKAEVLTITLYPSNVKIGETFTVFIESPRKLKTLMLNGLGEQQPVYRIWHKDHPFVYRSFLGVSLRKKAGDYPITAVAEGMNGKSIAGKAILTVQEKKFYTQKINVPKKKRSLVNVERLKKEGRILASRMKMRDRKVYFATQFIRPAKGRISSKFGARRKYLNGKFSSFHKGIDIANKKGTQVKATNAGRVSLVANMKSNGKIILINHGHGITSIYSHLSKFHVKEGQWVKKGQVIARIGTSGISTGPHLHFGISVNDVRVDPLQWVKGEVQLYYKEIKTAQKSQ